MWKHELVRMVRHMIDDLGATPTYTDDRLEELILLAAGFVNTDVDLRQDYTIDLDELTLSPDPTDSNARDEDFINLICLKAACILDISKTNSSVGQSIYIRDGSSAIDLRGVTANRLQLVKIGWCKEYKEAVETYSSQGIGVAGAAIMTPFKIYNYGNYQLSGHVGSNYRY